MMQILQNETLNIVPSICTELVCVYETHVLDAGMIEILGSVIVIFNFHSPDISGLFNHECVEKSSLFFLLDCISSCMD